MVKISILYPQAPGATFDMDYYLRVHMPLSLSRLRTHPGFVALSVERGVAGPQPGTAPPYIAMCHYTFASAGDFVAAFMPHAAELQGDMPNYTTIDPIVQVSEIAFTDAG